MAKKHNHAEAENVAEQTIAEASVPDGIVVDVADVDVAELPLPVAEDPAEDLDVPEIPLEGGGYLSPRTMDTVTIHHDERDVPQMLEIAFKNGATHLYFQHDPTIGDAIATILGVAKPLRIAIQKRLIPSAPRPE